MIIKFKHYIPICIIMIAMLLFAFSGCDFDSKEQKEINKANIEQAKTNAIAYIEEKYGFTADITDAVLERRQEMVVSTPLSSVLVYMSYDGKSFHTYIDGKSNNTDGADDYQYDEIKNAVREMTQKKIADVRDVYITGGAGRHIDDNIIGDDCDQLFSVRYNGENLTDVLDDEMCDVCIKFINADFSGAASDMFGDLTDNYEIRVTMISYRCEDAMKECVGYSTDEKRAVYIDSVCRLYENEKSVKRYDLRSYENFYYYVDSNDQCEVAFHKITPDDADNWNGRGSSDGDFVADAYELTSSDACTVYIYYPTVDIDKFSKNATRFATCRKSGSKNTYFAQSSVLSVVGEYTVQEIRFYEYNMVDSVYFSFLNR
ncbi:MAG: hypothetical protein Q4F95_08535 [Oscillospiraceae bacterium]|nr:hypothetical protein [Oscillospiraceae bacterium]